MKAQNPGGEPAPAALAAVAVYVMVPGQKLSLEMKEAGKTIAPDGVLLTNPGVVQATVRDGKVEVEALKVGVTFVTVPAGDGAGASNALVVVGRDQAEAARLLERVRAAQAGAR